MPEWLATSKMWSDTFVVGAPIAEKILRPILVYIFLVVALRIFGKRELAQLNPFDLVVLLSLSNTVQNAIIGNDNSLTGGLIGALALLALNYLVVRFLFRHRRLDEMLEGQPTLLIEHGKVKKNALAKELLTTAELMTVLHRQGFESVQDVEHCILEPGGTFDVKGIDPPAAKKAHDELMVALQDLTYQDRCPGAGAWPGVTFYNKEAGGMGEWLIPAVLKTVNGETRSGVRIPLPPPPPSCTNSRFAPEFGSPSALISNHEDELAVPPAPAPGFHSAGR